MGTLDNIRIKLFVLAVLTKNISREYLSLFFCLFTLCSVSVNALQIVFGNSSYESTAKLESYQIFKEDGLLVRVQMERLSPKRPLCYVCPEQQFPRLWRHTKIMGRR